MGGGCKSVLRFISLWLTMHLMGCIAVSFTKGDHELGTKCHRVDARRVSYNPRIDENIRPRGPGAVGEEDIWLF